MRVPIVSGIPSVLEPSGLIGDAIPPFNPPYGQSGTSSVKAQFHLMSTFRMHGIVVSSLSVHSLQRDSAPSRKLPPSIADCTLLTLPWS